MSYRRPQKDNYYNQKITITKTTITKETNKEVTKPNDYNEEELNDVIKAFEYFDINHNGKINISELMNVLSTFGNKMTEDELYKIFRDAGIELDTNEELDYIKFVNYWIGIGNK